ncbi:BPTD_3080 family restriction endonuclease [Gordonia sp. (in: high G+C Gram-positive bacteria)]|uniref:BPTD_3080 family restriction endonuclease n=1 Tax=Gordonia sp. (in: high G+C Gram-positive bacteria) TaxID=84139 RepID=UPI003526EA81
MAEGTIDDPVINSPYRVPARHFVLDDAGHPTGEIAHGRRPSASFVAIAPERKGKRGKGTQAAIDFGLTERVAENWLINEIRKEVGYWRTTGRYEGVTPITRKLLEHWADAERDNRVLFCQREAAETAIFLTEVAGRRNYRQDWRGRLDETNAEFNRGLPRIAMKMATGAGKTVVMAMLIAWQTLNKAQTPRDARFTNRFLVVAPGVTIRDRLKVLQPSDPDNYYQLRDLIPAGHETALDKAQIVITNWHAFQPKIKGEFSGVAKNTRKILRPGDPDDVFKESRSEVVARVLRDFGSGRGEIVVINDEAHHCYQDKPVTSTDLTAEEAAEDADARVWFEGIAAVRKKVGVKAVFDLSATPYFLSGSGHSQGTLFGWTVSDFSLMDAIESGIVKVPRTPVDDDATGSQVSYLHLWEHVKDGLPKRANVKLTLDEKPLPELLETALHSLYRSYTRAYKHWQCELEPLGETPPVFIVVCPNTAVSKLVYDWIGGWEAPRGDLLVKEPGLLDLFRNYDNGKALARPRTILVDSKQLESGEALSPDFKKVAATEIAAFKSQYRLENPGADAEKITDEEILREVMNTVGKKGKLGAEVRCVVSVAMLTEGWDANTVTHILGVRAFGSQLLCEQVVGRGLRRRSYVTNDDGLFEAEYANVYGIPFSFIPSDRPTKDPKPPQPTLHVQALPGREHLEIRFPRVEGYRMELPDPDLQFDTADVPKFVIGASEVPNRTESAPIVGEAEVDDGPDHTSRRRQAIVYKVAEYLMERYYQVGGDLRPWLFPQLRRIVTRWMDECVVEADGRTIVALIERTELRARACEQIVNAIQTYDGQQRARTRALLRADEPEGTTADVSFLTRKPAIETTKSQVSHCVLDGPTGGNTWEQILAGLCELNPRVASFVKNDRLGFDIPYVHSGRSHLYVPDFLLRLRRADGEGFDRFLIVEVSGGQKDPGQTEAKAKTAREIWCPAVNNHGGFGVWGYVEIADMVSAADKLNAAISAVYADDPIIGDPDVLDYPEERRGA